MKIIQVTDLHLGPKEQARYGANQHERLAAAVASINAAHGDAAVCVLTGDLADGGDGEAYRQLQEELGALRMPYRLILGNHDRRSEFLGVFPETVLSPGGFVQSILDVGEARLVFLDTMAEGRVDGALDAHRLAWLEEQLASAGGRPVFVFMHHPPVEIGIPMLDPLALSDAGPFLALLQRYGSVAHLFFGHVHRLVHGTVAGIPFSAQRGISFQFALDLQKHNDVVEAAPPTYGVILLEADRVVVHEESFLADWPRYDLRTGERIDLAPALSR